MKTSYSKDGKKKLVDNEKKEELKVENDEEEKLQLKQKSSPSSNLRNSYEATINSLEKNNLLDYRLLKDASDYQNIIDFNALYFSGSFFSVGSIYVENNSSKFVNILINIRGNCLNVKGTNIRPLRLDVNTMTNNYSPRRNFSAVDYGKQNFQSFIKDSTNFASSGPSQCDIFTDIKYDSSKNITSVKLSLERKENFIITSLGFSFPPMDEFSYIEDVGVYTSNNTKITDNDIVNFKSFDRYNKLTSVSLENSNNDITLSLKSDNTSKTLNEIQAALYKVYGGANKIYLKDCGKYKVFPKIGEYVIVWNTTSSKGQITTKVTIIDETGPEITPVDSKMQLSYSYGDIAISDRILGNFNIYDPSGIKDTKLDVSEDIFHTVGVKNFNIISVDMLNNQTKYPVQVNIFDDIGPEIVGYETLTVSKYKPMALKDILALFNAYDEIDGKTDIIVHSDDYHYENHTQMEGDYYIALSSVDNNGNSSYFDLKVTVNDKCEEPYFVKKGEIMINEGVCLTNEEIMKQMQEVGYIDKEANYVSCYKIKGFSINGNYAPGTYPLTLQCNKDDGTFDVIDINVKINRVIDVGDEDSNSSVNGDENSNDNESGNISSNDKEGKSFFQFFNDMFNALKNFFIKLFKF